MYVVSMRAPHKSLVTSFFDFSQFPHVCNSLLVNLLDQSPTGFRGEGLGEQLIQHKGRSKFHAHAPFGQSSHLFFRTR